MTEGKSRHDWNQTADLLALTANCHRDPKKSRPFVRGDFHPDVAQSAKQPVETTSDISILKVFVEK